jgi:hypothetical protein
MMRDHPRGAGRQSPLFVMPGTGGASVTSTYLTQALRVILSSLDYDAKNFSLHSLRRGGASCAYDASVNYAQIKAHGTWESDSFWKYITKDTLDTAVPSALAAAFLN